MSTGPADLELGGPGGLRPSRPAVVSTAVVLVVVAIGLSWAKWWPYAHKIDGLVGTGAWSGSSPLDVARDAPSVWTGAWDFTVAYTQAVWKALLVGLVLAAGIDALVPRRWVQRLLTRRSTTSSGLLAGALSLPSMMCTCCAAPIAVSLRRSGVPAPSVVAYWLGNPVLNPAVLVFLALVGPWQWVAARLLVGLGLVVGAAVLAGRLLPGRVTPPSGLVEEAKGEDDRPGGPVTRFARSLGRLSITLVPEYLLLVALVGAGAHLAPADLDLGAGPLALVALAVVALLVVIPTAGEIPVLLALAAAGASPWVLGLALLLLPSVSLPSLAMVGRALTWRVTAAVAGLTVASGVAAGAVIAVL